MTGAFAEQDLELRPERFRLLLVPPGDARAVLARFANLHAPFAAAILEPDGLSLLLSEQHVAAMGDLLRDARREADPYRVLTFRPELPWTVVGFLAKVSTLLADAGIPLGALAAFRRDHVFVRETRAEAAQSVLRRAIRDHRLP